MSALAEKLKLKYFGDWEHPYQIFDAHVAALLAPDGTLLDAGCGRTAPMLARYRGRAKRLIGIDTVPFTETIPMLELYQRDLVNTGLADESIDVIMARSVVEHIDDPIATYSEFARILRPGGAFVFLTANLWDYASLIAAAVPNRLHPWIVARTEGREEEDVFPVRYRSNTRRSIYRLAPAAGFEVDDFRYLGQYPNYFMFNGALFFLASWYEKTLAAVPSLHWLRGWILCTLRKPAR